MTFHPQNNKQAYLAYGLGLITDPEALPAPRTNEEVLLKELCVNGMGADVTITDGSYLFYDDIRIDHFDEIVEILGKLESARYMFYSTSFTEFDLGQLDFADGANFNYCFGESISLKKLTNGDRKPLRSNNFFYFARGCRALEEVDFPFVILMKEGERTETTNMFSSSLIKDVQIDFEFEGTPQWIDLSSMFSSCSKLETCPIDFSKLPKDKNVGLGSTFGGCTQMAGSVDLCGVPITNSGSSSGEIQSTFSSCKNVEEILNINPATNIYGNNFFPTGSLSPSRAKLRRVTFVDGCKGTLRYVDLRNCSFMRDGMVEFFNTMPGPNGTSNTITITGNPCVVGGTALTAQTSYTRYYDYDSLRAAAEERYICFDYQDAPVMYYLNSAGSSSAVEATFSAITPEMFDGDTVRVKFLADTITAPEGTQLTDEDRLIATNKGFVLVE